MTEPVAPAPRTTVILALFWGSILGSLLLPWALITVFEVSAHRRSLGDALAHLRLHLFAPGSEYFLIGVLSAAPFVVYAGFLLFHVGWNSRMDAAQRSRRMAGVLGSLILMVGVSFWTHLSALMYPDAQGALVYVFLPSILLVLMPIGYGLGRAALTFARLIRPREGELP